MISIKEKQLKDKVIKIFDDTVEDSNLKDSVKLKVVKRNPFSKKQAFVIMDNQKAIITLNLGNIVKENDDNAMLRINKTLRHEIEHVKMIFFNQKEDLYNYDHLMGLMEYLHYSNTFKNKFNKTPFYIYNYLGLRKQMNKNDDCSPLEITADLAGYSETKKLFGDTMSEEELENYEKIISCLKFLNKNFEIFYNLGSEASNRFSSFVLSSSDYITKNIDILEKYPILKNLFNDEGKLKNVYELYTQINSENKEMYDRLILDSFTSFKCDYSQYFNDDNFKEYVEKLFNNYVENTIDYYNNMEKGTIFVDNRQVLVDNLKMKKRNVLVLNSIAKLYEFNSSNKNILDSDHIFLYKKSQITNK